MSTLEAEDVAKNNEAAARRWGFWNRQIIGDGQSIYLDRISILTTPWFSIKLHRIYRPDNQRDHHDHPWSFLSIVLRGFYEESIPCNCCPGNPHSVARLVRRFNFKRAEDRHSIRYVSRSPVWTLVFTGRRRRIWGFWVDGGTRFIEWDKYEALNDA